MLVERGFFRAHLKGGWRGLQFLQSVENNTAFLRASLFLELNVELPEQSRQRLNVGANGSLVGHNLTVLASLLNRSDHLT